VLNPLKHQSTPRWIILLIDFILIEIGFVLAYNLRFNFDIPQLEWENYLISLPYYSATLLATFLFLKTYSGIIRHTDSEEISKVIQGIGISTVVLFLGNWGYYFLFTHKLYFPQSVLIIQVLCNLFLLLTFRFSVRWLYQRITNPIKGKRSVIIYGAGESGLITKKTLERDVESKMRVVAFMDDNAKLWGKKIGGIKISNPEHFSSLAKKSNASSLIISIQGISLKDIQKTIDEALELGVEVQNVPPVSKWIQGKLSANQIRSIRIEDLLGRSTIQTNNANILGFFAKKTVLVTGAAGSIGSELSRQLASLNCTKLILLDQAESALYDLQQELISIHPGAAEKIEFVIADVCDTQRLEKLFTYLCPQVIFHSAAYKHVPLMENNPAEAIRVNILGTKRLADKAHEFGVDQFVMVSTDKAVNPTNVMGASKRAAEIYVQNLNEKSKTAFITTRFGNVLGSNGSVIPLFKKQIENGGPITVTHPEITRYFMTIPEACSLVIEAGIMGKGGEIFVFDMGQSIRIIDLAKKMVELSGLQLNRDIEIKFTGLREGEKLYEELLNDAEKTRETHHPKIMIADISLPVIDQSFEDIYAQFETDLPMQKNEQLVRGLKVLVPEYKSNNSVYQELD
jgi:FlaA1/EpsC-like NDP-sugar epimerase